jgi:predicted extracellular nuclease
MKKLITLAAAAALLPSLANAQIHITEWLYSGSGGEFVELTNVGSSAIDLTGWSYDDDSRTPGVFSLSGFGVVAAGETVVFTETDAAAFVADWALVGTKVLGGYTNNLGRNDEINIFDAGGSLVDRLSYGDENFPGTLRTQNTSGRATFDALGANDPSKWVFSAIGDIDLSRMSSNGDVGSPGFSALAVPEPQTYALLLAGLAVVGAVARRRAA